MGSDVPIIRACPPKEGDSCAGSVRIVSRIMTANKKWTKSKGTAQMPRLHLLNTIPPIEANGPLEESRVFCQMSKKAQRSKIFNV